MHPSEENEGWPGYRGSGVVALTGQKGEINISKC